MSYSTAQKIAFGGLVAGSILCFIGGIAPHWQTAKIDVKSIGSAVGGLSGSVVGDLGASVVNEAVDNIVPGLGDITLVKFNGGLWWYCLESDLPGVESRCYSYEDDDNSDRREENERGALWVCRITCFACVVLSIVCGLTALCRQCCCDGGKTVCHGVMTFLAGAAGILCIAVFASQTRDGLGFKMKFVEFDWAFALFCVGAGIIVVVSFVLCFSSPNVNFRGMIYQYAPGAQPVPYSHMNEVGTTLQVQTTHVHPMGYAAADPVYPAVAPAYAPMGAQGENPSLPPPAVTNAAKV